MHIVFACPDFKIGGFSTYTLNLANALKKMGHSVSCIIADPLGELAQDFVVTFDNTMIVQRRYETRSNFIEKLVTSINELHPDAIINSAVPIVQASFPFLNNNIFRISVVHSLNEGELQIGCANIDYVDAVVTVAQNINISCSKLAYSNKLYTIPVGIPIESVRRKPRSNSEPIRLGYVGRITLSKKNVGLLEDILHLLWKKTIPFGMSFIGDGPYANDLKRNISKMPYSSQVRFYGALSPNEVTKLMEDFDITLLTSTSEGTPHVLLEAMSVGSVPVASYLPGSTDKIIEDGVSGFLCRELIPEVFTERISTLVNNANLLSELSRNAVDSVAKNYSISVIAAKYADIITNSVKEKSRSIGKDSGEIIFDVALNKHCHSFPRHLLRKLGDIKRSTMEGIRYIPNDEIQRIVSTKKQHSGKTDRNE